MPPSKIAQNKEIESKGGGGEEGKCKGRKLKGAPRPTTFTCEQGQKPSPALNLMAEEEKGSFGVSRTSAALRCEPTQQCTLPTFSLPHPLLSPSSSNKKPRREKQLLVLLWPWGNRQGGTPFPNQEPKASHQKVAQMHRRLPQPSGPWSKLSPKEMRFSK